MERFLTGAARYVVQQSWQIAALFAVVALTCLMLRKASAHWRHLLWVVVLAKCIAPPLLAVPLPLLPAGARGRQAARPSPSAPTEAAQPPVSVSVGPASASGQTTSAPPGVVGSASPAAARPQAPRQASAWTALQWTAVAWLAGAAGFGAWCLLRAWRTHRRLCRARRSAVGAVVRETRELARLLGLRRPPSVWLIDDGPQPFVWGFPRGAVYVPRELASSPEAGRRRALILHEFAHVARWDALVNAVQLLVQVTFFFHPLVWWANRRIRREREKCCDEAAVAALGGRAQDYGAAVIETLAGSNGGMRPPAVLAVTGGVRDLEERMRTIMRPNRTFRSRPTWAAIAAALLLAAVALPTGLDLTARAAELADDAGRTRRRPEPSERHDTELVPCIRKYSVVLVVSPDEMTFEGKPVTWEELPDRLKQLPHRGRTIFAVGLTDPGRFPEERRRELMARAGRLVREYRFEYLSYIGRHELGKKGDARFEPTVSPRQLDASRLPAGPLGQHLLGLWTGLAVDKPGQGTSEDVLTIELGQTDDGGLKGIAYGQFVRSGRCEMRNVALKDGALRFSVPHRSGGFGDDELIVLSLRLEGERLIGEGEPIGEGDACTVDLGRVLGFPAKRPKVSPADARLFAGRWKGMAVDKPGQGSSRDNIGIRIDDGEDGALKGIVSGTFANDEDRPVWDARVEKERLTFLTVHRSGAPMRVTLTRKGNELVGDAEPTGVEEDACSLRLERDRDPERHAESTGSTELF